MKKQTPHCILAAAITLLLAMPIHAQMPNLINYQGRLTDAQGNPVTGNRTMAVKVYDSPSGGNLTYQENIGTVAVKNGTYSFQFGSEGDGIIAVLIGFSDYLALSVNGTEEATRTRLLAVPYALKSADAQALAGVVESVSENISTIQGQTSSLASHLTALGGNVSSLMSQFRVVGLSGNLSFGSLPAGSSSQRQLTLSNKGFGRLTVHGMDLPNGYSGGWSGVLEPGASTNVTITFSPAAGGSFPGNISVNSDATGGTGIITVSGFGQSQGGQPTAAPRWAWVRKIDSGADYVDDKATALALASDGVWVGGETLDQHYIQKFGFNGENATQMFLLGKGDSVNALVSGPGGRVFGAADIWTNVVMEHRPARFFEAGAAGLTKQLILGTGTINGTAGYGDAYGIDYFGGAVYLTGYIAPWSWSDPNTGYFLDKALDLTGVEVPGYALFIAKIQPGNSASDPASVEWVKYGGLDIGEAIKVSNDGIFVAGEDGYVRCFSSSGNLVWQSPPAVQGYSTYSLAIDNSGQVWVAGETSPEIRKFNKATGLIEAAVSIPGVTGCMGICAHPDGGLVVNTYGFWPSEAGREAGFRIYRMLADGTTSWNKHISAGTASRSSQSKVAVSPTGEIYVAFTAGDSSDGMISPDRSFPEVQFEGYSQVFPFVPNSGASKGFVAALRFD